MPAEEAFFQTMVELTDTLVDDFDVVELFTLLTTRCVEVLDISAAGLMLVAPEGNLRVMASSSEAMHLLELFEVQADEGPCLVCYHTGAPVVTEDLAVADERWPRFATAALEVGFRSAHALPMRLRKTIIGALNLFNDEPGGMQDGDVIAAQAFADVATIAILQHRAFVDTQDLNAQLSRALNSRIVIEQAKGMLAERAGIDVDQAFGRLRGYARGHNLGLTAVARSFVEGTLAIGALDSAVVGRHRLP